MKSLFTLTSLLVFLSVRLFAEPSLKEATERQIERIKGATGKPSSGPEFAERIEQIFLRYSISNTVISGVSKDFKPVTINIFVKGEEVYVAASQGWNLVTDASGVYEWETGKQTGIKIKRNNEELLSYVNYMIDPSGILSSLYSGYKNMPEKYETAENKERSWTELRLKTPTYGFEAVFFSDNPFWLHGMRMKRPNGDTAEMTISKPRQVDTVPDEIMQRFKKIKFEESDLSLKRHLIYL